jgi:microcin C transport system permease protein
MVPEPPQTVTVAPEESVSVIRRRFRRFRRLKRGWYSFIVLFACYGASFFAHLIVNEKALIVRYGGELRFPAMGGYCEAKQFGQRRMGEAHYRSLDVALRDDGDPGTWVLMPPYPYGPIESLIREYDEPPPHAPSVTHWLGTDDRGRDVLARLVYGFWYSMTFALGVIGSAYVIGISVGASFGFFGGRFDIYGQRLVEIWAALPFLYTVMIVSSILRPSIRILIPLVRPATTWRPPS